MDRADDRTTDLTPESRCGTNRNNAAGCLAACAVLLLSVVLPLPDTAGHILHLPSVCPFYQMTGLPCPGCGLTRAFVLIGHGAWRRSLQFHPMGCLAYAGFLLKSADGLPLVAGLRSAPLLPRALQSRILWIIAALTLFAGALRLGMVLLGAPHTQF